MNYIDKNGRQSGRTTRMILDAIEQAKNGRAVYVLCPDSAIHYTKDLAHFLARKLGVDLDRLFIKFETVASLGGSQNIDWQNSRLPTAHPNCLLLIDHHVIAQRFGWAIELYHKYDQKNENWDEMEWQ